MTSPILKLWLARFKVFVRDVLLPPVIWRGAAAAVQSMRRHTRRIDKTKSQFPYAWNGDPFELGRSLRYVALEGELFATGITRMNDTRPAAEIPNGRDIRFGPFPENTRSVIAAVAQRSRDLSSRDLTVSLDRALVTELKGELVADTWNNFRIPIEDPSRISALRFSWTGDRLLLSEPVAERGVTSGGAQRPSVLVLVLDSMIPELVGCLSRKSRQDSLTPNIDRYFNKGRLYSNAYSQSEYTMPSLATMMTGLYPIQHGVFTHDRCQRSIPPEIPTLAEFLQDAGYRTFCYSTGRRFIPPYGHYRGFERFYFHNQSLVWTTNTVVDRAVEFIETHKDSPTFCFLHIIDTHPPFALPTYFSELHAGAVRWGDSRNLYGAFKLHRDSRDRVAELRDMERAMVRNLDFILGKLFAYLERECLDRNTLVIVLADHGREYLKGSPLLIRRLTHIPFLITGPGVEDGICDDFVEPPMDLYPTIAAAAGLPPPPHITGRDAINPSEGFREVCRSESLFRFSGEIALRMKDRTYAVRFPLDDLSGAGDLDTPEGEWLFKRDPMTKAEDEEVNLVDVEPHRTKEFRRLVREHYEGLERHFSNDNILAMTKDYPR